METNRCYCRHRERFLVKAEPLPGRSAAGSSLSQWRWGSRWTPKRQPRAESTARPIPSVSAKFRSNSQASNEKEQGFRRRVPNLRKRLMSHATPNPHLQEHYYAK